MYDVGRIAHTHRFDLMNNSGVLWHDHVLSPTPFSIEPVQRRRPFQPQAVKSI